MKGEQALELSKLVADQDALKNKTNINRQRAQIVLPLKVS